LRSQGRAFADEMTRIRPVSPTGSDDSNETVMPTIHAPQPRPAQSNFSNPLIGIYSRFYGNNNNN